MLFAWWLSLTLEEKKVGGLSPPTPNPPSGSDAYDIYSFDVNFFTKHFWCVDEVVKELFIQLSIIIQLDEEIGSFNL